MRVPELREVKLKSSLKSAPMTSESAHCKERLAAQSTTQRVLEGRGRLAAEGGRLQDGHGAFEGGQHRPAWRACGVHSKKWQSILGGGKGLGVCGRIEN